MSTFNPGLMNFGNTSSSMPIPLGAGSGANPTGTAGGSTTGSGAPMIPGGVGTTAPGMGTYTALQGTGTPTASPSTATGANNQVMAGNTQTQRQTDRTLGELQKYYGEGVGSFLFQLMQNGGQNPALANQLNTNEINAMQGPLNQGSANVNAILGAQGVSGNSSTSALANSNYWQQATAMENQQISQNYEDQYKMGQQMLMSLLPGIANTNQEGTANENNWMDNISAILQMGKGGGDLFSTLSDIIPGLG